MIGPDFGPTLDALMLRNIKEHMTEKAKAEGTQPLTIDALTEAVNRIKRAQGNFLVVECNHLPDECYGIIYLRPEDAKRAKQTTTQQVDVKAGSHEKKT